MKSDIQLCNVMKELRAPRSGAFSMKKEAFREFRAPGALQGTCTGGAPAGGGTAGPAGLPSPREAGATERRARPLVDLAGGVQRALVAARAWGAAEADWPLEHRPGTTQQPVVVCAVQHREHPVRKACRSSNNAPARRFQLRGNAAVKFSAK